MRGFLLVLGLLLASASAARADFDGTQLNDKCQDQNNPLSTTYCNAYIAGVLDMARDVDATGSAGGRLFCKPLDVSANELTNKVKQYLKDNPEQLSYSASSIVLEMMIHSYPC